jgi:hypothetical protein
MEGGIKMWGEKYGRIKWRKKFSWFFHITRRNSLVKHVMEERLSGRKDE